LRETTVALRASEQHYRGLIQILPDAVAVLDKQGRLTGGNHQGAVLLGYKSGTELLGRNLFDLCPPEEHERLRGMMQGILETGQPQTQELTLLTTDGQRLRIEASAAALRGPDRRPMGLVCVARDITPRKTAEALLRDSEERFRQITEHIEEVFWMTDPAKAQMLYISPAYERIWGQTCESLQRSPWKWVESIHPEERERVLEAARTKQVTGNYDEIYRIVRPDSSIRWIRDRAFPVRNEAGEVYRVLGIAEDITDLKQTEEQLAMLAHAVESTSQPICITDLQDRFTFVNQAFERTYGYRQSEILGKTPAVLFAPVNPPRLLQEILSQTRAGGWQGEVIDLRKDGTEIPIYLSTSQIRDSAGKVFGLMGVAQDNTERKRAEEQIRLLADALQSAQEMVSVTDRDNRITYVNAAFLKAYGYTEDEVLGRKPEFLYSAKNPAGLSEEVHQQTLAGGWRGEIINCRKDGAEFPISLSTSEIRTSGGKTLGLLGIARDITERKRAERLQSALAELGHRLSAATAREGAAQIILDVAAQLFGLDAGYVHLYSADKDEVNWLLTVDTIEGRLVPVEPPPAERVPHPLMRSILEQGPKIINRTGLTPADPNLLRFGDTTRLSAALMFVPIRAAGNAIGILSIQSYTPGAYSENDLHLLLALADHCGDALQRIEVSDALRAAEARYRGIVENASEGMFQTTPDGRYLSANPALARMLGYDTPEDLISSVKDIETQTYVLPGKRQKLKRLLETSNVVRDFEVERYRKDGSRIWVRINSHVVRDKSGKILYYEGTNQDITERKLAEQALEASQGLQRALLDNIADPAWLKDARGYFLACNEALARFYGLNPEEMVGKTLIDVAPDKAEALTREDNEAMKSRKSVVFEGSRVDAHGHIRWFESVKTPFFSPDGKVIGTVGIAREITARKRHEEELRQLPRLIIQAQETERKRVARELHDSVNQIVASARMRLRKVQESEAEFRPSTREILARCDDLLVQALDENRRIARDLRPLDLDDLGLVVACRNFCKQFQARTNLLVTCRMGRLAERLPPDAELHLFRIVQESFNNIEKHAHARTIRLRISTIKSALVLAISDDGCGFKTGVRRNVRGKPQGIGLTNIRERALALGATCEIESVPKRGTSITVRVPLPLQSKPLASRHSSP
jgi:PAS domain S-box-containing protein